LAYSAIAHAGYALVGLAGGGTRGIEGAVVYFAAYSAAAVGAFLVVGILSRGGGGDGLSDVAGLGRKRPLVAAAMTVFMISMVGIPLFAGFWGKFSVFLGAVEGGVVWLAVVGVLNSAMSFGYYGNVIRLMYLEGGRDMARAGSAAEEASGGVSLEAQTLAPGAEGWGIRVALVVAVGFTMLLGVVPGILFGALGVSAGL
jgi:NADH-quinone oxidoreductase subunit N